METREFNKSPNNRIALLKSVLMGAIAIAVAFIFRMHDETNDDTAIQRLIARPDSYTPFINRALSLALGALFKVCPNVSWWFVFSLAVIFFSIVTISFIFLKKVSGPWQWFVALTVFACCFSWALQGLNFTRTATIASFAAILLLLDGVCSGGIRSRKLSVSFSVILFIIGILIRKNGALLALGLVLVLAFVLAVTEYFLHKRIDKKQALTMLVAFAVLFSLTFVFSAVNSALLTTEEKEFLEYNSARSAIHDYKDSVLPFEGNEAFYKENNINCEEDLNLYIKYITEDWDVFTNESIINIAEKNSINAGGLSFGTVISNFADDLYKYITKPNPLLAVFSVVIAFALIIIPKRTRLAVLLEGLSLIAVVFCLELSGRVVWRVIDSIFAITALSVLYVFIVRKPDDNGIRTEFLGNIGAKRKPIPNKHFLKYLHGALCLSVAVIILGSFSISAKRTGRIKDAIDKQAELFTLMEESADIYFSVPGSSFSNYITIIPVTLGFDAPPSNRFSLGGWNARIPSTLDKLAVIGIDNPMKALFEDDRVLSEYNQRVISYLQRRYDENITASRIRTYKGVELVKYTSPIQGERVDKELECDITVQSIKQLEDKTEISGRVSGLADYPYLFVNINNGEVYKTFRLEKDQNGNFSAGLYISTDFDERDCSFIVKDKYGELYLLSE